MEPKHFHHVVGVLNANARIRTIRRKVGVSAPHFYEKTGYRLEDMAKYDPKLKTLLEKVEGSIQESDAYILERTETRG